MDKRKKVCVYSSNSMMQIETIPNSDLLSIEGSPMELNDSGGTSAAYTKKTQLQLSTQEMITLTSLFLGLLPYCEFKRPGKSIHMERQKNKIYARFSSTSGNTALPIQISDTVLVNAFVFSHLCQTLHYSPEILLSSLKGASALFSK